MSAPQITDAKNYNLNFCGPVALAMISGRSLPRIEADILNKRMGKQRKQGVVKGMPDVELIEALQRLGYQARNVQCWLGEKRVAQWIEDRAAYDLEKCWLVSTTDHFLVLQGQRGGCSLTGGKVVPIAEMAKLRAKVIFVWEIVKIGT